MLNPLLVATAQAFENLFDEEADVVFRGYLAKDRARCNNASVTVRRSRRKPGQRREDLLVLRIVADNGTRSYKDSAFSLSLFSLLRLISSSRAVSSLPENFIGIPARRHAMTRQCPRRPRVFAAVAEQWWYILRTKTDFHSSIDTS